MPATYDDRINGITMAVAIKAPCVVRTIANITLSGTQTIDGVAVVAGDRVLVVAQTTTSENGVWVASASAWARADDFNGSRDIVKGTLVTVLGGSTLGSQIIWQVITANPIVIGTTNLTIAAMALAAPQSYGTMADQDATAVNIDGGTIDGTIIGGSAAAAITGTVFTGNRFIPDNSTVPTNGMYLPATNSIGFSSNSSVVLSYDATNGCWNTYRGIYANAAVSNSPTTAGVFDYSSGIRISDTGSSGLNFYTEGAGISKQFSILHAASSNRSVSVIGSNGGDPVLSTTAGALVLNSSSGTMKIAASGCFTANGSATVTISALGPSGIVATIKKWFTIRDDTGAILYIPGWGT